MKLIRTFDDITFIMKSGAKVIDGNGNPIPYNMFLQLTLSMVAREVFNSWEYDGPNKQVEPLGENPSDVDRLVSVNDAAHRRMHEEYMTLIGNQQRRRGTVRFAIPDEEPRRVVTDANPLTQVELDGIIFNVRHDVAADIPAAVPHNIVNEEITITEDLWEMDGEEELEPHEEEEEDEPNEVLPI